MCVCVCVCAKLTCSMREWSRINFVAREKLVASSQAEEDAAGRQREKWRRNREAKKVCKDAKTKCK